MLQTWKNAPKDSTPENSAIQKLSIVISSSCTLSQRRKGAVRHEKVQSDRGAKDSTPETSTIQKLSISSNSRSTLSQKREKDAADMKRCGQTEAKDSTLSQRREKDAADMTRHSQTERPKTVLCHRGEKKMQKTWQGTVRQRGQRQPFVTQEREKDAADLTRHSQTERPKTVLCHTGERKRCSRLNKAQSDREAKDSPLSHRREKKMQQTWQGTVRQRGQRQYFVTQEREKDAADTEKGAVRQRGQQAGTYSSLFSSNKSWCSYCPCASCSFSWPISSFWLQARLLSFSSWWSTSTAFSNSSCLTLSCSFSTCSMCSTSISRMTSSSLSTSSACSLLQNARGLSSSDPAPFSNDCDSTSSSLLRRKALAFESLLWEGEMELKGRSRHSPGGRSKVTSSRMVTWEQSTGGRVGTVNNDQIWFS